MPQIASNGIQIEYALSGPDQGRPLLLIHGVGAQLVRWPDALCEDFAARGFRVIRFDNRDVGLSTHMHEAGRPDLSAILAAKQRGEVPALPYTLSDMAADTFGLLDALGIPAAHVVGVSLGGMIVQQMAIERPERILSMTIVMSQSGHPDLPPPDPAALATLAAPAPDPALDREAYLAHSVALNKALGSPLYPTGEAELRRFAGLAADRAYDPAGSLRQMAAGRAAPDRSPVLARIDIPTLVIHGVDDALMPVAAGEQLARIIPGAWLLAIKGMSHDLPDQLGSLFAGAIAANADRTPG
jgi:pimeloyl-ACP methyl ester carboxylesterase